MERGEAFVKERKWGDAYIKRMCGWLSDDDFEHKFE